MIPVPYSRPDERNSLENILAASRVIEKYVNREVIVPAPRKFRFRARPGITNYDMGLPIISIISTDNDITYNDSIISVEVDTEQIVEVTAIAGYGYLVNGTSVSVDATQTTGFGNGVVGALAIIGSELIYWTSETDVLRGVGTLPATAHTNEVIQHVMITPDLVMITDRLAGRVDTYTSQPGNRAFEIIDEQLQGLLADFVRPMSYLVGQPQEVRGSGGTTTGGGSSSGGTGGLDTDAVEALIADWAETDNTDQIPASKLENAPLGSGLTNDQVRGIIDSALKNKADESDLAAERTAREAADRGLGTRLDGKAPTNHPHADKADKTQLADLFKRVDIDGRKITFTKFNDEEISITVPVATGGMADGVVTAGSYDASTQTITLTVEGGDNVEIQVSQLVNSSELASALANKANTLHTHRESDITDLDVPDISNLASDADIAALFENVTVVQRNNLATFTFTRQNGTTKAVTISTVSGGMADGVVTAGSYDADTQMIELTVTGGSNVNINVSDLVNSSELVTQLNTKANTTALDAALRRILAVEQKFPVKSGDIADNAITKAKMADDSVGGRELEADAVATGHIADNAVTGPKIPSNTITSAHIGANQVGNSELSGNSVGTTEVQDDAITEDKLAQDVVDKLGGDALTDDGVLDLAKSTRTSADRGKFLGTSDTDENDIVLLDGTGGPGTKLEIEPTGNNNRTITLPSNYRTYDQLFVKFVDGQAGEISLAVDHLPTTGTIEYRSGGAVRLTWTAATRVLSINRGTFEPAYLFTAGVGGGGTTDLSEIEGEIDDLETGLGNVQTRLNTLQIPPHVDTLPIVVDSQYRYLIRDHFTPAKEQFFSGIPGEATVLSVGSYFGFGRGVSNNPPALNVSGQDINDVIPTASGIHDVYKRGSFVYLILRADKGKPDFLQIDAHGTGIPNPISVVPLTGNTRNLTIGGTAYVEYSGIPGVAFQADATWTILNGNRETIQFAVLFGTGDKTEYLKTDGTKESPIVTPSGYYRGEKGVWKLVPNNPGDTVQTPTYDAIGGTITWNVDNGNIGDVALTGSPTLTITGGSDGTSALLRISQDSTGNRRLNLNNNIVRFADAPTLSTGANKRDRLMFHKVGTTWEYHGMVSEA